MELAPQQHLITAQVARQLNVTLNTAKKLLCGGSFPNAWKLPNKRGDWRIPESDVRAFIERHRAAGGGDMESNPAVERKLDRLIDDAIARRRGSPTATDAPVKKPGSPRSFDGGLMDFSEDRVELREVKICGGQECGMIRRILDELRKTNGHARYVRYGGKELAKLVECERGQNGVAEAVRAFRDHVCQIMLAEANVQMDRMHDIILNDRRYGYRLPSKITVRGADDPVNEPQTHMRDVVNDAQNDVVKGGDDPENNERQQWALELMKTGVEFRKSNLVGRFCCSATTVERDLRCLRRRGLIEFTGPARTGYWRLVR